jgi:hypothetical protein
MNESYHFSGKKQEARDLLKMHIRGIAKAEAQFFKIFGGTPSGPGPLEVSNSRNN